jgi:hypothetical protein
VPTDVGLIDAVDGSSTRHVSAIDVGAVKAPTIRRSQVTQAITTSRHREVSLSGSRHRCGGQCHPTPSASSGATAWHSSRSCHRAQSVSKPALRRIIGRAQGLGHTVRLMPPAYVKPYVKRHKDDATDAEAIAAKRSISSLEIPSLVGYPSCQVINSGEECSQNWGCVRLVISDDQIDGRRLAFEGTAGHGPR